MKKQLIILACIPLFFVVVILSAYTANFVLIPFIAEEAVIKVHIVELDTAHKKGDDYWYDGNRYVYTGTSKSILIVPIRGENSFLLIRGYEKEGRHD